MAASINPGPEETLIFTYGTLKRNFPNHPLLESLISSNDAVFLGQCSTIFPLPLLLGPFNIPYLINRPGSGLKVRGELYSLSTFGLARLDDLEGVSVGHYERGPIEIEIESGGDDERERKRVVEAYFAHSGFAEEMWEKRRGNDGMEEYGELEARGYVGREFRPHGADFDFVGAIREFLG